METVRQAVADNVAPKFDMELDMIWGNDGREMRLQAIEHAQMPVNRQSSGFGLLRAPQILFCRLLQSRLAAPPQSLRGKEKVEVCEIKRIVDSM